MKASDLTRSMPQSLIGLVFTVMPLSLSLWALEPPKRWVSTSPQLTELLFQLDLGEKVVGTTDQSDYPSAARKIRRVGRLFAPNLEAILSCAPDLVLWDSSSFDPTLESRLFSMGIPSLKFPLDSVESVFAASRRLIQEFRPGKKPDVLIRAEIEWDLRRKRNFSFIALAWADPPMVFGKKTFLFSLLEGLGGNSILPARWNTQYLKVSEEWIMAQNPTHLFYLKHDALSAFATKEQCKKWWPNQTVECVGIDAEKFARASLTPLLFLSTLDFIGKNKQ